MALAAHATGSITTTAAYQTIGSAITTGKTAVLTIDASNMVAADEVYIKVLVKVVSAGSAITYRIWPISNASTSEPAYISPPVPGMYHVEFQIIRMSGTDKAFPFTIVTLD